jgi:hypothetical protein
MKSLTDELADYMRNGVGKRSTDHVRILEKWKTLCGSDIPMRKLLPFADELEEELNFLLNSENPNSVSNQPTEE